MSTVGDGLRAIFRPALGPPLRALRLLLAARRLVRATRHEGDVGACFDAVLQSDLFRPLQHRAEFLGLLGRASTLRPSEILEIGSDGDHRYEGVAADLAACGRPVRPEGLVAFHDIGSGRQRSATAR